MSDMDMMAAMGISGFGKSKQKPKLDPARFDKAKRQTESQPAAPEPEQPAASTSDTPQDSKFVEPEYDPSDNEADTIDDFPITHELVLKDHTKVISALTLDPSGARILSGSHDYDCKLWDFGGMDHSCRPFTTWEPAGSYHINDVRFSNDGQKFLVISGTTQAKLYDRDGEEQATFIKGDMYIRDMKHTQGHVSEVTSCAWHPKDPKIFITGSADSTIRIWDTENKRKQKNVIVVKSKERGARTKVLACSYSPDGTLIGAACLDGALHLWKADSNFVRPNQTIEGAHVKNTETGSLVFSVDGKTLLTRGGPGDDTVKLWDVRSFRKPLAVRSGLPALYPRANAMFSPDEKFVITGSGATTKGGRGEIVIMKREDLEIVKTIQVGATPVKVYWHSKINQIVAGLSNGQILVLYSPLTSLNGAKLLINKGPPRKVTAEDMSGAVIEPTIIIPQEVPMFSDSDGISLASITGKRKREKGQPDPRKARRPELPVTGPGRGGRVGASATQHVVQNLVRNTTRDEDPREALLKYADAGNKDPLWTAAWQKNQPNPVFAKVEEEEKEEGDE